MRPSSSAQKAFAEWREWPIRERAQVLYKLRELMVATSRSSLARQPRERQDLRRGQGRGREGHRVRRVRLLAAEPRRRQPARGEPRRRVRASCTSRSASSRASRPSTSRSWSRCGCSRRPSWAATRSSSSRASRCRCRHAPRASCSPRRACPTGVFNIVQGGRDVVEAFCDHPGIKAVGFVGSTKVAKLVYGARRRATASARSASAARRTTSSWCPTPTSSHRENVVASFTGCAGQRCMAASVLLAVGDCRHILDAVKARAAKIGWARHRPGHQPRRPEAHPRLHRRRREARAPRSCSTAAASAAPTAATGSARRSSTALHAPTCPPAEEIFGPVLSIIRVPNIDEALEIENANPYGNASRVYTTSGDVARA
jgi:malonate-semialdehyde dehydrogenase (acetylating)/methylmalonate-semialdehyde dehydrogenase